MRIFDRNRPFYSLGAFCLRVFIAVIIFGNLSSQASRTHTFQMTGGRTAVTAPALHLESAAGLEAQPENASSKFIVPNEFGNFFQYDRLPEAPGNRAALSVGSVRAFNLLGAGRRDSLITLDYADGVRAFNENLAKLIENSDRISFLAGIIGVDSKRFDLSSRKGVLDAVDAALQDRRHPHSAVPHWNKFYAALPPPPTQMSQSPWRAWLIALKSYAENEQSWNATFFAGETAYSHVKSVIRGGRFYALRGSLSGDLTLAAVAKILREKNYVVSELDVSNAIEHIANYEGHDGVRRFTKNLALLPKDEFSRVLLTIDRRHVSEGQLAGEPMQGKWAYLTKTFEEVQDGLKKVDSPQTLTAAFSRIAGPQPGCRKIFESMTAKP